LGDLAKVKKAIRYPPLFLVDEPIVGQEIFQQIQNNNFK